RNNTKPRRPMEARDERQRRTGESGLEVDDHLVLRPNRLAFPRRARSKLEGLQILGKLAIVAAVPCRREYRLADHSSLLVDVEVRDHVKAVNARRSWNGRDEHLQRRRRIIFEVASAGPRPDS